MKFVTQMNSIVQLFFFLFLLYIIMAETLKINISC
jgi:hypothetical protein